VGFRFQSLLDSMLQYPSGLLSNCDAGGHDDDDGDDVSLPHFLALLPAPDCRMMGVFSFCPSGVLFCFFSILNALSHLCFVL
jgi:hypothetical protein